MKRLRSVLGRRRIREFMTFFGGSAVGLTIDLVGFQLLLLLGLEPWLANATSSTASITAVYLLVTRYSFGVGTRLSTYAAFFTWYALSIVIFSALIQLAVGVTDCHPFLWKLVSVPVSFLLNYTFSRFLFRATGSGPDDKLERGEEPKSPYTS